jgi:hypothetical protein
MVGPFEGFTDYLCTMLPFLNSNTDAIDVYNGYMQYENAKLYQFMKTIGNDCSWLINHLPSKIQIIIESGIVGDNAVYDAEPHKWAGHPVAVTTMGSLFTGLSAATRLSASAAFIDGCMGFSFTSKLQTGFLTDLMIKKQYGNTYFSNKTIWGLAAAQLISPLLILVESGAYDEMTRMCQVGAFNMKVVNTSDTILKDLSAFMGSAAFQQLNPGSWGDAIRGFAAVLSQGKNISGISLD